MISIKHLSFSYTKDKPVLDDISFDILDGECVVLLGPNGVGKSTLISCILGENKPKTGDMCFDNRKFNEISNKEKSTYLAYVPQLIDGNELTVEETITLGRLPYFYIAPTKEDKEKVNEIISRFGLESIRYKSTNEISGGERQKVAIARAFVQEAKVVVFDEPTSNLDIKSQLSIISLIKEHNKNSGNSSLISMHDINQALKVGDKFIFLKENKIFKICTKDEIDEELLKSIYDVNAKIIKDEKEAFVIYE